LQSRKTFLARKKGRSPRLGSSLFCYPCCR